MAVAGKLLARKGNRAPKRKNRACSARSCHSTHGLRVRYAAKDTGSGTRDLIRSIGRL